ncbi:hypothetical protein D3C87_1868670 [compost metagenome]
MAVHRQVGQRMHFRERHQRARQPRQFLEQAFGMQLRVMEQVRQRGVGFVGGVQQPEGSHVARAELNDVLAGFAMKAVQRVDLGL